MPEFICVSWSLFSIFSWKNWRHFAVTLRCVPTRVCWPVCPWLFKFFSMPRTRLTTGRQNVLLPAPSMSALPFSEVLVAVFQQLLQAPRFLFRMRLQSLWPTLFISPAQLSLVRFVQRTSLPVFQRGSSPVSSFVFPGLFSSSALDVASSFSSVAGTLRFPPFCVSLHRCFYHPRLLLGIFWLGGLRLQLLCRMFFPAFLHTAKVWTESFSFSITLAPVPCGVILLPCSNSVHFE